MSIIHYVARAHRQHSSVVVTIPKGARHWINVKAGDLVLFAVDTEKNACAIAQLIPGGSKDAKRNKHSSRKNKGR